MRVPSTLTLECPSCGNVTIHDLKKGKLSTKAKIIYDTVVECTECNFVHHTVITEEKHVDIPLIISDEKESKKDTISMPPSTVLRVGDEMMLDDNNIMITGIELEKKRVQSAVAADVKTLWCKRYDKVKVKVSINRGSRTLSRSLYAVPDEEFFIGDIIRSGTDQIVIHKIKTGAKVIKTGGTTARKIVRLYGRLVR